jgi:rubrerythrin
MNKKNEEEDMANSEENLKEAFAGESQANRKYLAFAKKADQEGFAEVAKLFRAAAAAETVHAHNHLRQLGGIRATKDNLEEALGGEVFEFQKMYPAMLTTAQSEGNKGAETSFHYANEVEKVHAALYKKAIDNLGKNAVTEYHVCPVCGNTFEGEPPDVCPICGVKKASFMKID